MTDPAEFLELVASDADYGAAIRKKTENTRLNMFKLRCQIPLQGRSDMIAAATPVLNVVLKAYASGGENTLHAHHIDDHSFIILQGSATFYGEGNVKVARLGRYEGIMIPHGALYRFEAGEEEPLVLLRVGALLPNVESAGSRRSADGSKADSFSGQNKQVELILSDTLTFG